MGTLVRRLASPNIIGALADEGPWIADDGMIPPSTAGQDLWGGDQSAFVSTSSSLSLMPYARRLVDIRITRAFLAGDRSRL